MKKLISVLALVFLPSHLAGQGILDEFSYEGLRFSGIGLDVGGIASDRLRSAPFGGLRIDYGYFAPRVRLVFGLSYFKADFDREEINQFERSLRRVVNDPENNFTIVVGNISWSDISADMDLVYEFSRQSRITTYGGLGLGIHVRNGTGSAIDGTFVEDALDTVAAGFNVLLGGEVSLFSKLSSYVDFRLGLTSELNVASARIGVMYRPASTAR